MSLPTKLQDVPGWAEGYRERCVSEKGRLTVDLLEAIVSKMVAEDDPEVFAKLAAQANGMIRAIAQVEKVKDAENMAELRAKAERDEAKIKRLGLH